VIWSWNPAPPSGTPGDWWTVFALSADTCDHASGLFAYYQSPACELDPKLCELGQVRAGWTCSSLFVSSQRLKAARDQGVPEEQIEAIGAWQVADCFSPVERAVLAFTDALTLGQGRVADDIFVVLHEHLSEVAILEFRYIIGSYIMHATTNGRCGLNSMMLATTWSKFLICPATSNASARNSPL
jgi:alkylhydroperoxidase family enzyme